MLPKIEGKLVPNSLLGNFSFERVLSYYDGPRLIILRSSAGQFFLAWWNDTDENADRWIYLPLSERRLHQLLTGEMTCLEGLKSPEDGYLFVVDEDLRDDSNDQTMLVGPDALPEESLPYPEARFDYSPPFEVTDMATRVRAHLLDIRFHSRITTNHGLVSARTLGKTVSELQSLLDAIGQEVGQSSPNMMGRIPDRILEQTRLNPVAAYSGSFGIRLESHQQDGMSGTSLIRSSLNRFYDLIEVVADPEARFATSKLEVREPKSSEQFYGVRETEAGYVPPASRHGVEEFYAHADTEVEPLGRYVLWPGPRVRKRLESLLFSMAAFPGEVTLSWIKPPPDQNRTVTLKLDRSRAQTLLGGPA